jgi:hypothetical protein
MTPGLASSRNNHENCCSISSSLFHRVPSGPRLFRQQKRGALPTRVYENNTVFSSSGLDFAATSIFRNFGWAIGVYLINRVNGKQTRT